MGRSLYFLVYRARGKRPELALRVLSPNSKDFTRIRGDRASKVLEVVSKVLNMCALNYSVVKGEGGEFILELPADTGYAVLLFMLLTYSARSPKKHADLLEELLAGRIALSNYLGAFVDIATCLSELRAATRRSSDVVVHGCVAKEVSGIMRGLAGLLRKYRS
jgi:hypothetical protein